MTCAVALALLLSAAPHAGEAEARQEPAPALGESTVGARLGELYAFRRVGGRGDAAAPGVGVFWLYDARWLLAEVAVDLYSGDDNHLFAAGVGAYYPLLRRDLTPYLGGNVRYALSTFGGQGANGFQLGATAGALYRGFAPFELRAEVGWFWNLFRERLGEVAATSTGATSGRSVVAQGPIGSLGVGF